MITRDGDVEFEPTEEERAAAARVLEARRHLAVAVTPAARDRARRRLREALERQAVLTPE